MEITEVRPWKRERQQPGVMLCDARSVPPRVAAVLIIDGNTFYSDWAPSEKVLASFKRRKDDQIMALELLSIAFGSDPLCTFCAAYSYFLLCAGLSTFQTTIEGRDLRVYSDNVGAEHAVKKGKARAWDHTCIVHGIWHVFFWPIPCSPCAGECRGLCLTG